MTTREKMIKRRESLQLSVEQMAARCRMSAKLLEMVESGHVTHPDIASRMIAPYRLTLEDFNEIVPECRKVEKLPDYVLPADERIFKGYAHYINEMQKNARKVKQCL